MNAARDAAEAVKNITPEQAVNVAVAGIGFVPGGHIISAGVTAYEAGAGHKITGRTLTEAERAAAMAMATAKVCLPGGSAAFALGAKIGEKIL